MPFGRRSGKTVRAASITLTGLFTALMIAGAYISIPIAGWVPITFQPFVSILAGSIIGPRLGSLAVLVYMALGLSGVPVFAGFTGGITKVMAPSFGFIIGFVAAAFVSGLIVGRGKLNFAKALLACFAGTLAIYAAGVPYMHFMLTTVAGKSWPFSKTVVAMAPFFLKDMALAAVASALAARLVPVAKSAIKKA